MGASKLPSSSQAVHVGLLRSTEGGNMVALMARLSAHGKSLFTVAACGLNRRHHGNPAASLCVKSLYCATRLYSGLADLILSRGEFNVLQLHQRRTLEKLQRLYPSTPAPAPHFLSGTLPSLAILYLRRFTLIFMIARLGPSNPLHLQAPYSLHQHAPSPSHHPRASEPRWLE